MQRLLFFLVLAVLGLSNCQQQSSASTDKADTMKTTDNPYYSRTDTTPLNVSDAEWKKILPDSIYQVARKKGTEMAFTGKYWNYTGIGTYYCAACGNALFRSGAKFASTCGWPSFLKQCVPTASFMPRIVLSV